MRVISIDPGYGRCGIAVVSKDKNETKERLVFSECFETDKEDTFHERLSALGKEVENVIKEYNPDICAIEKLYFNSNQKTAMKVSQVRGMIAYIALSHDLSVFEYTPLEIKNAITGYGKSSKRQVVDMLHNLIKIPKKIKYDDEYDAIATGITCLVTESNRF